MAASIYSMKCSIDAFKANVASQAQLKQGRKLLHWKLKLWKRINRNRLICCCFTFTCVCENHLVFLWCWWCLC